jgi:hypothetical protein
MFKKSLIAVGALMIFSAIILVACGTATTSPPPTEEAPVIPTEAPVATAAPSEAPLAVPFVDAWKASGHNNVTGEQFRHWDDATANPDGVPATCARCHTSAGFVDYAADGKVDSPVPAAQAQGVTCTACHSSEARALTSVTFPSGKVVETSEEGEAVCMTCHQGRESKVSVDKQINDTFKVTDVDAVIAPIKDDKGANVNFGFRNIHYFAAGATLYGSQAEAGYEYDGNIYDPKFRHVADVDTCLACHDQHATTVRVDKCATCHTGVTKVEDLQNVRMNGSLKDYNGNGDVKEGIAAEIKGLQASLYASIQAYATEVSGTPIVYEAATNPYFFVADKDGKIAKDDKGANIRYNKFTARLLKAAYNYQLSVKDPGAFAHNGKYVIELLYDSLVDLNASDKLKTKTDMSKMARNDAAHFAGNTEPFRHWDAEGVVSFSCAKCHSATGLPQFIKNNGALVLTSTGSLTVAGIGNQPTSNGFMCTTCHTTAAGPDLIPVTSVPFPSGAKLTFSTEKDDKGNLKPVNANLCIECHQGRESTNSVNAALKAFASKPDEVALQADGKTPGISFKNIHYFAAGATLFGDLAKGAYQYADQKYVGQNLEHPLNKCTDCHDVHQLGVKVTACAACHTTVKTEADLFGIRMDKTDYNGNGDTTEGIYKEVDSFRAALYAEIQKYAETKAGAPIIYDPSANPYFFVDKDKDGKADKDDKGAVIRYSTWTPRLLTAAYNLQLSYKDPGGFAHNPKYVMQFLYDSIKDLGGDVSKLTRPEVPAAK